MRLPFRPQLHFPSLWPVLALILCSVVANVPWPPSLALMQVAYFLSWPGYNGYLIAVILFLVLPYTRLFPSVPGELSRRFWTVADVLLFSCLFSQVAKYLLRWPRPSGGPSGAVSGHTMCTFCLAWLLATFHPRSAPYAFAFTLAIGWSRVYVWDHYPYQVVLGAIFGTMVGYAGTHCTNGLVLPRLLKLRLPVISRRVSTEVLAGETAA